MTDSMTAHPDMREAVAWAVELADGSIGGLGWSPMNTLPTAQRMAMLHDGCRYVFAYHAATVEALRAKLARVEALAEEWEQRAAREDEDGDKYETDDGALRLNMCASDLLAALKDTTP